MISMPLLAEDGVEVPGEFAVAVADQKAKRGGASWSAQANWRACWVTQCPGAGGVGGAAGEVDAAAAQLDEEEDVEAPQRDGLDGEEVDREHAPRLLAQERPPRESAPATRGTEAGLPQDLADSRRRHFQVEPVDLAGDPLVAATRVLSGQAEHELADLAAERRSACSAMVCPAASDEPPVPAQQRGRSHQE
jgi:hypothetical protein